MKNLQLKNRLFFTLLFAFVFSLNIQANCINSISEETEQLEFVNAVEDVKDGKWKERWKELTEGFLEGFKDAVSPVANGGNNDNNITNADLEYLTKFAFEHIRTKENALEMMYQMQQLVENENQIIKEDELLKVFNSPPPNSEFRDILKRILRQKNNVKPTQTSMKSNKMLSLKSKKMGVSRAGHGDIIILDKERPGIFRTIGYVIGWIAGKIIKDKV